MWAPVGPKNYIKLHWLNCGCHLQQNIFTQFSDISLWKCNKSPMQLVGRKMGVAIFSGAYLGNDLKLGAKICCVYITSIELCWKIFLQNLSWSLTNFQKFRWFGIEWPTGITDLAETNITILSIKNILKTRRKYSLFTTSFRPMFLKADINTATESPFSAFPLTQSLSIVRVCSTWLRGAFSENVSMLACWKPNSTAKNFQELPMSFDIPAICFSSRTSWKLPATEKSNYSWLFMSSKYRIKNTLFCQIQGQAMNRGIFSIKDPSVFCFVLVPSR